MSSDGENKDFEEEVDDLFGDDEEIPLVDEQEQDQEGKSNSRTGVSDDENNNDDGDSSEDEEELKTLEVSFPRHAITAEPESDTYLLKMPVFLNVDSHPFDPNAFKEKVKNSTEAKTGTEKQIHHEMVSEKLLNENTIRWRYSNINDEIVKQSNAHFVEWDDGSLSLKIGQEMFDFKTVPLFDSILVRSDDTKEVIQSDSLINKSVSLLPTSTLTSTHRRLTAAVKSIQQKDRILNTLTQDDPMLKQRIADETEKKTLKARRQLDAKRRLQEERMEARASSPSLTEPTYERFARTYGEDEYDEDDFVAGDDEEEEEEEEEEEDEEAEDEEEAKRAERLRKLKEDGATKYKAPSEEPEQRKKRRIIEDDEDED